MRPLVEDRTIRHVWAVQNTVKRKNNGENMIRLILLCVVFFVLVQLFKQQTIQRGDD